MKPFQDLPIQRKMLVMTLTICGAVQVVAISLLILFQILNFRANFQRDTATLSTIIANNSTAALAFDDRNAAGEILNSLKAKPVVLSASLVNSAGVTVAHYGQQDDSVQLKKFPPEHLFLYLSGHLLYTEPVQLAGKHIGDLYLRVNYRSVLLELLRFYSMVITGVIVISVLLAVKLTGRMQKSIADPVLNLAETSRQVGEKNDYSVRSPLDGRGDEVGVLAKAFNHMLSRIDRQDAALTLSQKKMESLVNSIDGIVWEWNPHDGKFTFVSRQSDRILGYQPQNWLANPKFWDAMVHPDDLVRAAGARLEATQRRQPYSCEYRMMAAGGRMVWIRESGMVLVEQGQLINVRGIFQDITEQKAAAAELDRLNRQLVDSSRQAGMAEVATDVLHNVGNVLNSVNVSANLLRDQLGRSHLQTLLKATQLLRDHSDDTAAYLTQDPRGMLLPGFLIKLGDHLQAEQQAYQLELSGLGKNIEHIKEIVSMQQDYARLGGITEVIDVRELADDALRINEATLLRQGITVVREFGDGALVKVDKHKVLQIIVNLVRNAKHALVACDKSEKLLTVAIRVTGRERIQIEVRDNGIGIPAENLTRIFQHGFTTKKNGHGFGLHSGANAAKEMGGTMRMHSDGPGHGAVFTLELPAASRETIRPASRQLQSNHLSTDLKYECNAIN